GIVPVMAEVTAVLLDERPGPFHAGGICGTGDRLWRWQLRNVSRHVAQIVVPESLHHVVLDNPQFFPEHDQLDREVEGRLPPEGGHLGNCRLSARAVTGETRRE